MIKSIGGRNDDLSIVTGFDRTLYDAFKNALERGQTKAWQQILNYIQKEFIHSFGNNSTVVMQQLNWLPSAVYNLSTGNQEASKIIANEFGAFFKSLSWIFKSDDKQKDVIGEHPQRFYLFFKTLMNFYHYAIHNPDELVVRDILNDFQDIAGDDYDFDTRFEIQNMADATQLAKKSIRDKATKNHLLMITQRRATLTLLSWVTYLFLMDQLTAERCSFLINQLNLRYEFFEDLLEDIDYIRSNERADYLGISFWDYMERPTGQMYSPPSAYNWILYGASFLLLRDQLPNFSADVIVDDREHGFLLDAMRQNLQDFKLKLRKISGIVWWDSVTSADEDLQHDEQLQQHFQEREEQILTMFRTIKILHEEEENRQIIAQQLDPTLINSFREKLYDKWQANCLIYQLFDDKGTLKPVDSAEGLDTHGQLILLEHQKMMFVKEGQQIIYGSEDLGSAVGRGVDERFIYDVTRLAPQQKTESDQDFDSVSAGLDAGIATLRANDFEPDAIIVPSEFFYNSDMVSSAKYKRANLTEKSIQIGSYDSIPVLRLFAQGIKSKAILTSFAQALSLELWENEKLYKRRMHLELRELTRSEVESDFEKDQTKWITSSDNTTLSEEQAKLRIEASLMLEMWTKGKFKIIEPKAVTWCRFTPAATAKLKV